MAKKKPSPENVAMHKAFEKRIKEIYTITNCLNEYTLDRDEHGSYTNMSVRMEWPGFVSGWFAAKRFFKKAK
jgi:hypothetical protein